MSLWKIAWRSLQQRALSSWLTGLSMALGVALVICVLVIHGVISRSFANAAQGYHLILGAKGGKLQLVLNTVFHLSQPIENVPYSFYKEFIEYEDKDGKLVPGKYAPQVRVAVPYCLGDSYKNFRVVGTTPDLFDKLSYGAYKNGTPKTYKWAAGENFDPKDFSAAVIGSVAAYKTGLKVGDRFPITHGVADDENSHVHEEDLFHVTGILEPTGTPNDRAVFVNMEGFYLISDHARPVDKKEPTAEERESARQTEKLKEARGQLAEAAHGTNVPAPVAERIGKAEQLVNSVIKALGSDEVDDHEHDHAAEHTDDSHDEHHGDHADDGHSSAHDVPAEQPADEHQHEHNDHDHEDHGHDDHGHDHSHDHGHHHHENREPLPEAQREVTAILVLMKNDLYSNLVYNKVNEGNVAQAVFPAREVATLFEGVVGHVQMILLVLAALVVVVAGIGVMVSIYNSMSDRSREIGIMRALGAGRSTVMMVVLLESILLALLGGFAGVLIGHGAIGALSPLIVAQTGVSVGPFQFETNELILVPALIILAALVGYLPALVAYRTDVAKALSAAP